MKYIVQIYSSFIINILSIQLINGRHFKGGSMSFRPIEELNNSVKIELQTHFSWMRSNGIDFYCNQSTIESKNSLGEKFNILCTVGCNKIDQILYDLFNNSLTTSTLCISWSLNDDWSFGEKLTQLYLPKKDNIQLSFMSNSWISLVVNGINAANPPSSSNFEFRLTLNLLRRNDTNKINSSPTTLMPPVFKFAYGLKHSIKIPVLDADNDVVKCRWANQTKKECADVCLAVPDGTLNSEDCVLIFDATNAQLGWYVAAIQIEDFETSSSILPFSSIPIQFLILVEKSTAPCFEKPIIKTDFFDDSCFSIPIGLNITENIYAYNNCTETNITDIQIIGPSGLTILSSHFSFEFLSNSYVNSWHTVITWKPQSNQIGPNLICIKAETTSLLSSDLVCFTLFVGINNQSESSPQLISVSPNGPIFIYVNLTNYITFEIQFDAKIKKPNKVGLSFIRFNNLLTDQEVLKIDTSLLDEEINFNNNTLSLNISVQNLEPINYYIIFDYGIVVGNDDCRSICDQMIDKSFWNFELFPIYTSTTTKIDQIENENFTNIETTTLLASTLKELNSSMSTSAIISNSISSNVILNRSCNNDCNSNSLTFLLFIFTAGFYIIHCNILVFSIKYIFLN